MFLNDAVAVFEFYGILWKQRLPLPAETAYLLIKRNGVAKGLNYLFIGIGFMLVFITAKLVLGIAFFILELIFELPLLKEMNKLAGLAIESGFMLVKIWMVFGLISFMSPIDFMAKTMQLLNDTVLAKLIYDNNLLLSFIISIL